MRRARLDFGLAPTCWSAARFLIARQKAPTRLRPSRINGSGRSRICRIRVRSVRPSSTKFCTTRTQRGRLPVASTWFPSAVHTAAAVLLRGAGPCNQSRHAMPERRKLPCACQRTPNRTTRKWSRTLPSRPGPLPLPVLSRCIEAVRGEYPWSSRRCSRSTGLENNLTEASKTPPAAT